MKKLSLRIRLILSFILVASGVWLSAGIMSWYESREQLDEFFDTYQLILARQLSTADWESLSASSQKKADYLLDNLGDDGEEDDEALGFAVFDKNGKMIFNDNENGTLFSYNQSANGFVNQAIGHKGKLWRIVWIKSADGKYSIAVGQELEYRNEAAFDMVEETLMPWLIGLTILMLATVWLITCELRPLKSIADDLRKRNPDDLSPLIHNNVPKEIKPLVNAVNQLFEQIEYMLEKERSFISDSAHELRSPLTALKVQLEVAMLSDDDEQTRKEALNKLSLGIERSARLIEQLLTLSRLEADSYNKSLEQSALDWKDIINKVAEEQQEALKDKNITMAISTVENFYVNEGSPLLCSLMIRNLIDNAVKYSPKDAAIFVNCSKEEISIHNSGVTVNKEHLNSLGSRFFRPAGQKENGSGLGLSIVKRIAQINHCEVSFENDEFGFKVIITPQK